VLGEGARVKQESLEQTARYWVVQDKQENTCGRELARDPVQFENDAMKDVYVRCPKKIAAQVCTVYDDVTYVKRKN
jgi:hypothetical protein